MTPLLRISARYLALTAVISACEHESSRMLLAASLQIPGDSVVITRRIAVDSQDVLAVSDDGRYAASFDSDANRIVISERPAGTRRQLRLKAETPDGYVEYMEFSPDGKRLAFTWYDAPTAAVTLNIIGTDGTSERVLRRTGEAVTYMRVTDWSPDGRQLLAVLYAKDRSHQIVAISTRDGAVRVLRSLDWRVPHGLEFSPDGGAIAYDLPKSRDAGGRDVVVVDLEKNRETFVTNDAEPKELAGWATDGKSLFYVVQRGGAGSVMRVALHNFRPAGPPEVVRSDIWGMYFVGMSGGALYYDVSNETNVVRVLPLDFSSGRLTGPVTRVATGKDISLGVRWSPDGTQLAFVRQRGERASIAILDVATGQERVVPLEMEAAFPGSWSHPTTLTIGGSRRGQPGAYDLDLATGTARPCPNSTPRECLDNLRARPRRLLADGRPQYRVTRTVDRGADSVAIVFGRDSSGQNERALYRASAARVLAPSPDEQTLAILAADTSGHWRLVLVSTSGAATPRVIRSGLPVNLPERLKGFMWTRDSRHYALLLDTGTSMSRRTELWVVAAESGEAQPVASMYGTGFNPQISPDGHRIAFVGRDDGRPFEHWVMENLPGTPRPRGR